MPWTPTAPGIDEARLTAIVNTIIIELPNLNTALTYDGLMPAGFTMLPTNCIIGDPQTFPQFSVAPILICVAGGGRYDSRDFETSQLYIDVSSSSGYKNLFWTSVLVYIHQDNYKNLDFETQTAKRELLRARICDWLRAGVFNNVNYRVIPLASQEMQAVGATTFDKLDKCLLVSGDKGFFEKSFGATQQLYGAHLVHVGLVA